MSGPVDDDNTMLVSGAYECVAENDIGVGTSEPLEVRVLCKLLYPLREIMMGVGNRVASVIMLTFPSEPCPHADG